MLLQEYPWKNLHLAAFSLHSCISDAGVLKCISESQGYFYINSGETKLYIAGSLVAVFCSSSKMIFFAFKKSIK